MAADRLADPALQRATLGTGTASAEIFWRTVVLAGDQGTIQVTARLVEPLDCVIDRNTGSVVFSFLDAGVPVAPPALSVSRAASTPPTIIEGDTARFLVTASYKGLAVPATFDWSASTGAAEDIAGTASGVAIPIGAVSDTAELVVPTVNRPGSQGVRILTVSLSNPVGATLGTAVASVVIGDTAPLSELPTPLRPIAAGPSTLRAVLTGTSAYGPLRPGDHVILDDGTYDGAAIAFGRSGSATDPIVIRARNKLGARFKVPMGIKADHVWFWGLDLTDGRNAYADVMGVSLRGTSGTEPCQLAFEGADCRFLRGRIAWTKMKDTGRGVAPTKMQGIQVSSRCEGFRFLRNEVRFAGVPLLGEIPSSPSTSNAYFVRPLILHMRVGGPNNNRNAEIGWNLFKGFPGGDWWDDLNGAGWGRQVGYDKLVRGTCFGIGAEYNDNVNALTSGIDVHHNLIAENGADMDFGGIRCNGQGSCFLRYNTNASGDGMRLRVAQNWRIVGNYIKSEARGLYGAYGSGHHYIGNYSEPPIAARSGNCTNESLDPYPTSTAQWAATGYPGAQGSPRPACRANKFYGNKGPLFVGWDQFGDSNAALVAGTEVYGHMSLAGQVRSAFNSTDLVNKGNTVGDTVISSSIPSGITVPDAVQLAETDVGPNS